MAHYYTRNRETAYTVPYANGKPGKATKVTDARELGLVPSSTGVESMQPKPGVVWWQRSKSALAGAEHANLLPKMDEKDWLRMVHREADKATERAAEVGSIMHDIIEAVVNNDPMPDVEFPMPDPDKFFDSFCEWWPKQGITVLETELVVVHPLGYGGRIDLVGIDEDERDVILDWKTRDTTGKKIEQLVYKDSNPLQLVSYLEGYKYYIGTKHGAYVNDPRLLNVIISRDEPGRIESYEWPREEHGRYWGWFKHLLGAWKYKNNYDPAF